MPPKSVIHIKKLAQEQRNKTIDIEVDVFAVCKDYNYTK